MCFVYIEPAESLYNSHILTMILTFIIIIPSVNEYRKQC